MTTALDPEPRPLVLRSPHDLLAAIPYRLGFRPAECVVVACTTADGHLGLVARVALDDLARPDVADGLEPLVRAVVDQRPRALTAVLYTARDGAPARALLGTAIAAVDVGVDVDRWIVTDGGYRGIDCDDPACCPEQGHPPAALETSEIAVAHVLAGRQVAPSREVAYRIAPAPADRRALAGRAARRSHDTAADCPDESARRAWRTAALDAWREATRCVPVPTERHRGHDAPADQPLGAALLGRVAAGLADRRVRDAVLLTLVPGGDGGAQDTVTAADPAAVDRATAETLARVVDPADAVRPDPGKAERAQAVLELVVSHTPRRWHAPAATLLAFLAWWRGDGARASYRVDEALAADPDHRLAHLVASVVAAGLPPGWVRAEG